MYMPTVLRIQGFQFIIFSSDHPPAHVHVRRDGKLAKVLLNPILFERTGGFNSGEQNKILDLVREHQEFLLSQWQRLYGTED